MLPEYLADELNRLEARGPVDPRVRWHFDQIAKGRRRSRSLYYRATCPYRRAELAAVASELAAARANP